MSKKVLVLSASPRRGENSDLLYDQFMLVEQMDEVKVHVKVALNIRLNPVEIKEVSLC